MTRTSWGQTNPISPNFCHPVDTITSMNTFFKITTYVCSTFEPLGNKSSIKLMSKLKSTCNFSTLLILLLFMFTCICQKNLLRYVRKFFFFLVASKTSVAVNTSARDYKRCIQLTEPRFSCIWHMYICISITCNLVSRCEVCKKHTANKFAVLDREMCLSKPLKNWPSKSAKSDFNESLKNSPNK